VIELQKININFISTWHPRYDETEKDEAEYQTLVDLAAIDIENIKTFSKSTFLRILCWKSPRLKGIVRLKDFDVYQNGIRLAHDAVEDEKIKMLIQLYGIGAPFGSTILHFMYPDSFPIFDVRTVETLNFARLIQFKRTNPTHYASFRSVMLNLLRENQPFSLREIDRALFAFHKIQLTQKQSKKKETNRNKDPGSCEISIMEKVLSVFEYRLGEIFKTEAIIDLVVDAYPGTNRGSIMPSDYCYNQINKGESSFILHIFESLGKGTYKCLGTKYQYSGPIFWKNEHVGEWKDGNFDLWKDPRKFPLENSNQ